MTVGLKINKETGLNPLLECTQGSSCHILKVDRADSNTLGATSWAFKIN
jgi:hypothetical protein